MEGTIADHNRIEKVITVVVTSPGVESRETKSADVYMVKIKVFPRNIGVGVKPEEDSTLRIAITWRDTPVSNDNDIINLDVHVVRSNASACTDKNACALNAVEGRGLAGIQRSKANRRCGGSIGHGHSNIQRWAVERTCELKNN